MRVLLERVLPYLACAVFVVGTSVRVARWRRVPVPFHLTLFPAPRNAGERVVVVASELVSGRSLRPENRSLWLWSMLLHACLAAVIVGHLVGISYLRTQFTVLGLSTPASRTLSGAMGLAAGIGMAVSLGALAYRRVTDPTVRRLSRPSHHLELALLAGIALTGLLMAIPAFGVDLAQVRSYIGGLLTGRFAPLPDAGMFLVHLLLVEALLVYFPFSRLLHAAGFFVIRAMVTEPPPRYPTPAQVPPRSDLATASGPAGGLGWPPVRSDRRARP
jgi:nitrate reductase gamma subunit